MKIIECQKIKENKYGYINNMSQHRFKFYTYGLQIFYLYIIINYIKSRSRKG